MPVMEIRTRVDLREGMELIFDPGIEALAGESSTFFSKYAGMKATITGFGHNTPGVSEMMRRAAGGEIKKGSPDRIKVRFENGDEPEHSLYYVHFRIP